MRVRGGGRGGDWGGGGGGRRLFPSLSGSLCTLLKERTAVAIMSLLPPLNRLTAWHNVQHTDLATLCLWVRIPAETPLFCL